MGIHTLHRTQKLPADSETVWEFIAAPDNLKIITPDYMGFEINSNDLPDKMFPGMIISYKVSPFFGIKMDWITEITHVSERTFFVDEQRIGPYRLWHHQHHLRAIDNGVLMTDIVNYKLPFGPLGTLVHTLAVRKKLEEIFNYRFDKLVEIFGSFD